MKITKDSYFVFSGGEVHCKIPNSPEFIKYGIPNKTSITLLDYTMNGLMALTEHVQVLRNSWGVENLELLIPYFPYARQDRFTSLDQPFSLKLYCEFINVLNFSRVTICDPHSDVAPALLNNCFICHQDMFVKTMLLREIQDKDVLFVSPDAGAYKKVAKVMPDDSRIVIGTKHRDLTTGQITSSDVLIPNGVDISGKTCIVIDDICDGGRTFTELGKVLKQKGVKDMRLYVTHGIFSKGLDELLDLYSVIYTTNSFDQSRYVGSQGLGRLVVKELF